jgi:hypothetical protein
VETLPPVCRRGVEADDIHHVVQNALVIEEVAEDPIRYRVLGPDRSANLLELVVSDRPQGAAVTPVMTMTEQSQRGSNPCLHLEGADRNVGA